MKATDFFLGAGEDGVGEVLSTILLYLISQASWTFETNIPRTQVGKLYQKNPKQDNQSSTNQ